MSVTTSSGSEQEAAVGMDEHATRLISRIIKAGAAIVGIGLLFLFSPYFTVDQNERTIVTNWGEVFYAAGPGIHFRVPVMQGLIPVPIDVRSVRLNKLNTYTIDSQELTATLVLQYRVPADKVIEIYTNLGLNYEVKLESMVVDRFKTVLGQVNAIDLASQRGAIGKRVLEIVRADAAKQYYGLDVTDIQLVNVDWNEAFRTAISNASVAKARVDQQEQEKRQAEVQAQQNVVEATGLANAKVAEAEGTAKSVRINAEAQAYATRQNGEAQAAALEAQGRALGNNPRVVDLNWAQRWNGQAPQAIYGANPMTMIMGK